MIADVLPSQIICGWLQSDMLPVSLEAISILTYNVYNDT